MPPKVRVSKNDIINAALDIVRESGAQALNARTLAARLKCSTQPIFSNYRSMDEVRADVLKTVHKLYLEYLKNDMEEVKYPPYKASGMAYIRFAEEEKELFKLLFMRDRSNDDTESDGEEVGSIISIVQQNMGLSYEDARMFHLEMWICVHGIAAMLVTSYLKLDGESISKMLSDIYNGLKKHYTSGEER